MVPAPFRPTLPRRLVAFLLTQPLELLQEFCLPDLAYPVLTTLGGLRVHGVVHGGPLQGILPGFSVIVDAAFLNHGKRAPFQKLAADHAVPYLILKLNAPDELLRERIRQRVNDVSDAGLDVLEHQLLNQQPLHEDETSAVITVDTTQAIDTDAIIDKISIDKTGTDKY